MKKLFILIILLSSRFVQAQQLPEIDISEFKSTLETEINQNRESLEKWKECFKTCIFSKPIQCDDSTTDCKKVKEAAEYLEIVCIVKFVNEQSLEQFPIKLLIDTYKKESQNSSMEKATYKRKAQNQAKKKVEEFSDERELSEKREVPNQKRRETEDWQPLFRYKI